MAIGAVNWCFVGPACAMLGGQESANPSSRLTGLKFRIS
jgi:hypothetical protein